MRTLSTVHSLLLTVLLAVPAVAADRPARTSAPWVALHVLDQQNDADLQAFEAQLPALAALGVNVLVLEVDYAFEFRSHPELRLRDEVITRAGSRRFVEACRRQGIRVIPQFQSFGHQSWAKQTFPLLTKYPELDLTPGAFAGNAGIYCREWDPTNPRVYEIVYGLVDEIVDAFDADAVHVGMDEVFLIGNDAAPSTKDKDPAEVFAKAVNDMYAHVVKARGLEMLMWGDRLIDASRQEYGEWEASKNYTWPAIYMIPKDVIIADWHYEPRGSYPSVAMFAEKGFRVLPTSFKDVDASRHLIEYARGLKDPRVLGHLFTSWSKLDKPAEWPPLAANARLVASPPAGAGSAPGR